MVRFSEKRGEVSSAQIIGIVLAIAGFLVVLAFIYGFQSNVTTNDDVCKLSVVGRATAQDILSGSGQYIPLKCTTSKICITDGFFGSGCSQFAGEQNVQTVKLSGTDSEKIDTIESISAGAMYDCWNMMGQGKLDLFSKYSTNLGWNPSDSTCVICSRVALSNNINANVLNGVDMNNYLATHQVPGSSLTYLQTFTDAGVSAFPVVDEKSYKIGLTTKNQATLNTLQNNAFTALNAYNAIKNDATKSDAVKQAALANATEQQAIFDAVNNVAKKKLDFNFARNETSIVFMQIKSPSVKDALANQLTLGASVAGGAFAIAPGKTLASVRTIFSFLGGELTAWSAGVTAVVDVTYTALNTYEGQKAAAGYCGSLTSAEKANQGCSLVQIMPYSFTDISNLCTHIQGNP